MKLKFSTLGGETRRIVCLLGAICLLVFLVRMFSIHSLTKDLHIFAAKNAEHVANVVAKLVAIHRSEANETRHFGGVRSFRRRLQKMDMIESHDIVVVDENKTILADVIPDNVGNSFRHDANDEVAKTMHDGIPRTFVETSKDYPNGIKQLVVPIDPEGRPSRYALIFEYSLLYDSANELIQKAERAIFGLMIAGILITGGIAFFLVEQKRRRVSAETELRQSREFLESILNTLDDPVFVKDERHRWILLSEKAYRLIGRSREDLLGKSDFDLFPDDQAKASWGTDDLVLETGATSFREEQVVWQRKLHTISTKKSLFQDPVTGERMIAGVIRDITEKKRVLHALQESRESCLSMLDNSKLGFVVYRAKEDGSGFSIADVSAGTENIENIRKKEILGKNVVDIFPGVVEFGLFQVFQRVWRTGTPEHLPVSFYRDGRISGWRDNYVYKLPSGEIVALYTDETDLEKIKSDLNLSEERFRLLFERSSDGILLLDGNRFIDCNQAAASMMGFSEKAALVSRRPAELSPQRQSDGRLSAEKAEEMISKAFARDSLRFEWMHRRRDGADLPVEVLLFPIPYGDRRVLFTICRDVSDRKRAEDALRASEANYRALFNAAVDGIIVQDVYTGTVIDANRRMSEMFSRSREELLVLNLDYLERLCLDRNSIHAGGLKSVFEGAACGEPQVFELAIAGETGSPFWVEAHVKRTAINDRPVLLWTFRDISERKKDETVRKDLEAHLLRAQKMEAIGTLAGGIAHDFNNILMAVMGSAELARYRLDAQNPATKHIGQILKACSRATELVRQILSFGRRSGSGPNPLKVGIVLKEAMKLLEASLPKTIDIHQRIKAENDMILGDSTQIYQLLLNLCTNAHHAMLETGGTLEVRLENRSVPAESPHQYPELEPGDYLMLRVRDTGHGMKPEILERIFDPYFTTKEKGLGTGLGLAMVHGIVKAHGGKVKVLSVEGAGTTFDVYFPLIESRIDPEPEEQGALPGGSEHVLFVDDEEILADIARSMLHRLGYRVTTRTSSLEALEAFRHKPDAFDLVITDTAMPHMAGDRLSREILGIRPDIPVILCTGFSETITEDKAREMGIRAFVMKPVVMADLAKIVRKALDGKT